MNEPAVVSQMPTDDTRLPGSETKDFKLTLSLKPHRHDDEESRKTLQTE